MNLDHLKEWINKFQTTRQHTHTPSNKVFKLSSWIWRHQNILFNMIMFLFIVLTNICEDMVGQLQSTYSIRLYVESEVVEEVVNIMWWSWQNIQLRRKDVICGRNLVLRWWLTRHGVNVTHVFECWSWLKFLSNRKGSNMLILWLRLHLFRIVGSVILLEK